MHSGAFGAENQELLVLLNMECRLLLCGLNAVVDKLVRLSHLQ
ncbi:unnamed protein product [Ophioblennius macclurei]